VKIVFVQVPFEEYLVRVKPPGEWIVAQVRLIVVLENKCEVVM
jgi:hypothetical protein